MATVSPPPTMNLWVVLSESKRIINAHSRHFLALSVLFLLPLCFSVTVYPSVFRLITDQSSASHNSVSLLRGGDQPPPADIDIETVVLLLIAYIVVVTVFNLLAIGSIAYSVFQGFYGRPVKLISAVKSSFTSFFPLLATLISSNSIVFGILLILGFGAFLSTRLIELIFPSLEFDFASPYFQALSAVVTIISVVIVIKLYVKWILAWVVVVVESVWGLTPLKRSKSLVKGMESVSLSLIVFFAITQSSLVWFSTVAASAQIDDDSGDGETGKLWTNAFFMLQIVITSAFLTLLTLYNLAATTVMYMYCKAVHGELAWEIAEEFAREYVSLPFDDGKVPHLVSVAYNNI
ncbi:hypothetical protein EUTSA_v10005445mg [Eutrema salsugineum]|uniref:Uncharacterized protein n=1 Tax=Eutrema salsugineum TaxID=72664 RepID=V4KNZ9_EUTSA|nr:uncharacterized protein LOC18012467 [Eutrema salsugineum]ESQ32999.1 hypothetical protein EUTSA_v10005445mg [Eutrema salsugineum]